MSQNFKTHRKLVPLYHFALALLVLAYFLLTAYRLLKHPSLRTLMGFVLGLILVLLFYYARAFALAVQDRLIRLEMRLRLAEVLPSELQGRILELTPDHLIGLRFASDAELPDLVERALAGSFTKRDDIKRAIRDWQADDYRA